MNATEVYTFLMSNPAFHLATSVGDTPFVRTLLLYRADPDGILFHSGKFKDLHQQLMQNPKVELCFNSFQENKQVRVSGSVTLIEEESLKKEIVENRDFLKPWVQEGGLDGLSVYSVNKGKATVWTMETNFAAKSYIDL